MAAVRARVMWGTASQLHHKFAHHLRDFAVGTGGDFSGVNPAQLRGLIDGCRDVVCQFLEVESCIIHATLKFIGPCPSENRSQAPIYTVARSSQSSRTPEIGIPHPAGHNSDFSALLGCADRQYLWSQPYSVFACGDLTAPHVHYDCSRVNWQNCYRTTLVLPLRYPDPHTLEQQFMGFLTFDSLRANVFGDIPDIFRHIGNGRDEYTEKLSKCPLVHLTGVMADILATTIFLLLSRQTPPPPLPQPTAITDI